MTRGQANLVAFAVAVLVVASGAGLALLTADGAFAAADRRPLDRAAATGLGDRLVAADAPTAVRANVLNATRLDRLDAALTAWFPSTRTLTVRVTLDDRVVAERGDPATGVTVRHVVLVATTTRRTITPAFTGRTTNVTLPRRTTAVTVDVRPPPGTTVTTVRANDRVVLHDPGGLAGTYAVRVSRFETTRLSVAATDDIGPGSVRVTYRPIVTRKAVLGVTVDA